MQDDAIAIGGKMRFWNRLTAQDRPVLLLSIAAQLVLALFFGHAYDMRIFMASGYLTGTGQNPYAAQDLSAVFHNSSFRDMTSIGYPPPWPLMLGLIYRSVYALIPNLLLYNLAIKIPIILANVGVAYLSVHILKLLGVDTATTRKAWIFLLLNPFMLYFSSAWGQIDSIVALLSLSALVLVQAGKLKGPAMLLALAISFKPTAIAILPVVLIFLMGKSLRQTITFAITFFCGILLFCIAPFMMPGWDPDPILRGWNAQFTVGGGMSFMTFLELVNDSYQLPGAWWLIGLAWMPALGVGMVVLRHGISGFTHLLRSSAGMIMLFFLTRSWLSEPNIMLILPFVLILTSIGELNVLTLRAVWILPLIFTFFNTSPPQLLFPSFPGVMTDMLKWDETFRFARLVMRTVVVLPWLITGWWIVIACFSKQQSSALQSQRAPYKHLQEEHSAKGES
jgi:hypothetical protein